MNLNDRRALMIDRIEVRILTLDKMNSKDSGRAILHLMEPRYSPQKYNNYEPIRNTYDRDKIDEALELWDGLFLWRRSPRILGMANVSGWVHHSLSLSMSTSSFDLREIKRIFMEVGELFGTVMAYIYIGTRDDAEDLDYYCTHLEDYSQGMTTHQLREGLPGLCWVTLFGKPYQQLFGGKLSDVPAYSVEEIGGATCIQLTESFRDVDKKRDEYETAQQAAIKHLDSNAFRVMGKARKYNVPEFNL